MSSVSAIGRHILSFNSGTDKDSLLCATEVFKQRMREVIQKNINSTRILCNSCKATGKTGDRPCPYCNITNGKFNPSIYPSFDDIRTSHRLPICRTYRPFITMSSEYTCVKPTGNPPSFGGLVSFGMPAGADFVSDSVVHMKFEGFKANNVEDRVRYAEWFGHRLFKKTSFMHFQQERDSYTTELYNLHYQINVPVGKSNAYKRNVGQEVPNQAYFAPDPTVNEYRQYLKIGSGPQTYKQIQPVLEIWMPILFWYKEIADAMPNYMLPVGSTEVQIQLEEITKLMSFADYSLSGQSFVTPTITLCEMYVNNLYVDPLIMKIYRERFQFKLIRVYKTMSIPVTTASNEIPLPLLNQITETVYVGFKPDAQASHSQKWHRNTFLVENTIRLPIVSAINTIVSNSCVYYTESHPLRDVTIVADTFKLFPATSPTFFNSHMGAERSITENAPIDVGWMQFIFSTDKSSKEITGYLNASNVKKLSLIYNSESDPNNGNLSYIGKDTPYHVDIIAICINVLQSTVDANGTAHFSLRYT